MRPQWVTWMVRSIKMGPGFFDQGPFGPVRVEFLLGLRVLNLQLAPGRVCLFRQLVHYFEELL